MLKLECFILKENDSKAKLKKLVKLLKFTLIYQDFQNLGLELLGFFVIEMFSSIASRRRIKLLRIPFMSLTRELGRGSDTDREIPFIYIFSFY